MKKTQQLNSKASFKTLLNVQIDKIPEKKSRSRSIRDRNNTTNQFSISRQTQNQQKSINHDKNLRERQKTWSNEQRIDKNGQKPLKNSNQLYKPILRQPSKQNSSPDNQQGSIQKIRSQMRKQSQQLKSKSRQPSNSRLLKQSPNSANKSRQHSFNKFRDQPSRQTFNQPAHNQQQHVLGQTGQCQAQPPIKWSEESQAKQLDRIRHRLAAVSMSFQQLKQHPSLRQDPSASLPSQSPDSQSQLRQQAQDLSNIIQAFNITFKQTLSQSTERMLQRLQAFASKHEQTQQAVMVGERDAEDAYNKVLERIKGGYGWEKGNGKGDLVGDIGQGCKDGLELQKMKRNHSRLVFSEIQRKLLMAEQRLLK